MMRTFLLNKFVKLEYHTEEYSSFAKFQPPYVAVFQPNLLYLCTFFTGSCSKSVEFGDGKWLARVGRTVHLMFRRLLEILLGHN